MRVRRVLYALVAYVALCCTVGIVFVEGALHPARRQVDESTRLTIQNRLANFGSDVQHVSIEGADRIPLNAWYVRSQRSTDVVVLLHGLGDNRTGMTGYAQLFFRHGFDVLMPDARAHGESGGTLATYGLLERNDIHRWVEWLTQKEQPRCIYAFGESMGAAQALQSLAVERRFCAVIAESSFSSLREIAYDRVGQVFRTRPWLGRTLLRPAVDAGFFYARWRYGLDLEQASPEDAVSRSMTSVFLIHGILDTNIPIRHSRQIYGRNHSAVLWEVPDADHCGAISVAPAEFEERVLQWLQGHALKI